MNVYDTSPAERQRIATDSREVLGQAVDIWDTVAHLEADGRGDALARAHGHRDIFSHTAALIDDLEFRFSGMSARLPLTLRDNLGAAFRRVVIMVSGAMLCLTAIPAQAGEWTVFWAGAAGWLSGQTVSAAIWHGLSTGRRDAAAKAALVTILSSLALGLVGSLIIGGTSVFLWSAWGAFASAVVILRPSGRLHWGVLLAAAGALFLQSMHFTVLATCLSVVTIASVGVTAASIMLPELLDRSVKAVPGMGRAIGLAVVQTLGQVSVLGILVIVVGPPGFYAVAVAGLIAGAAADPLLEIGYAAVRHVVNNPTSWQQGRVSTALVGVASMTMIVLAGVVGVAILLHDRNPTPQLWQLSLSAIVLTSALTGGTGTLLRGGSALGAALAAVATALGAVTLLPTSFFGGATVVVLGVLSLVVFLVMSGIAAVRMSHPSSW